MMRGNAVNCAGGVPFGCLEFFLFEYFKNNIYPEIDQKELNFRQKFTCGGLAGAFTATILNPLGVIKTCLTVE